MKKLLIVPIVVLSVLIVGSMTIIGQKLAELEGVSFDGQLTAGPAGGITTVKSVVPYDIYVATYHTSPPQTLQLWALDASEQLVLLGEIDQNGSCPVSTGPTLSMDSSNQLYFSKGGGGSIKIYPLSYNATTNKYHCGALASTAVTTASSNTWGAAVLSINALNNFALGWNNATGALGKSFFGISPFGTPNWSFNALINPTLVPPAQLTGLSSDLVSVGLDKVVTSVGGNSTNNLVYFTLPGMGGYHVVGSTATKGVTGLASRVVNGQPVVYSFTNLIGSPAKSHMFKHVLSADRSTVLSTAELPLPANFDSSYTIFHDAASAPFASVEADYGDAPDTEFGSGYNNYLTSAADGGPAMTISNTVILGRAVDSEYGYQLYTSSYLDDNHLGVNSFGSFSLLSPGDDEDGIEYIGTPIKGTTIKTAFVTPTGGYVTGWIDFNQDGDFLDEGELVHNAMHLPTSTQVNTYIPTTALTGTTYARYIIKPDSTPASSVGPGGIGEVEDHPIKIQ